jgi:adenylate cyclase
MSGNAILIGWAATAAQADRKPTSVHPNAPGVVVHGTIFNAIMTGELWRTLPHGVTVSTTLLLGLIVTVIVTLLPPGRAAGYTGLLAALYIVVNGLLLFDYGNVILGLAGPFMAIALVWAVGTMVRLILEGFERARITKRFAAYVDPELVEFVLEQQTDEVFKGVKREITTVFTDLQGFTSLSEKLGTDIVPILNDFMDRATRVIKKHHGYVNKFLGDGVMFFYNAPRPRTTHARDAVATVIELYLMLEQFNKELAAKSLPTLALRAGVSTGELIVGDAGSRERCDYTVIGDAANLAARLESANKAIGTRNMMTARTIELAGDQYLFRPVGRLQVVGQTIGVMVYEAVAPLSEATPEQKRLTELTTAMVEASLDGRPADCLEACAAIEEEFGESKLTHLYREKCEQFLNDPSPGEFDRQIVLTSK